MRVATAPELAAVPALALAPIALNTGFARAVLEGLAPGRLWVNATAPAARAAHVLHHYGMSFAWGERLGEVTDALAAHLRAGAYRQRDEWLQIDPRWQALPWDRLLDAVPGDPQQPPGGPRVQRYGRVNFRFDPERFRARHGGAASLPAGWRLRPMSAHEFALPGVSVSPVAFWRDAAQFLAHGGGWCAECDGEVSAIAFASFRFDDALEIGIETLPRHRGRGLARAAAVALIERLLSAHLTPVWSCRRENVASYELACRLGFVPVCVAPYYRLPASAAAPVRSR